MQPLVTIGMPSYNRADYIKRSVNSILDQTYTNFELIIYDDGSSDNTLEILDTLSDERINYFSFSNKGVPEPLNYIYKEAKGEFIIILHDNDLFDETLIERCVNSLKMYKDVGFILPGASNIDPDGETNLVELLEDLPLENKGNQFLREILENKKSFTCRFHGCSMIRRSALEKVGFYYSKKYSWYADIDLWMRLLKEHDFIYLKENLIKFTRREAEHEINSQPIKTLNLLHEIHSDNLNRNFNNQQELSLYRHYLSQRYFNEVFRIFVSQIALGNNEITGQIEEIKKDALNKFHFLVFNILRLKLVSILLVLYKNLKNYLKYT